MEWDSLKRSVNLAVALVLQSAHPGVMQGELGEKQRGREAWGGGLLEDVLGLSSLSPLLAPSPTKSPNLLTSLLLLPPGK